MGRQRVDGGWVQPAAPAGFQRSRARNMPGDTKPIGSSCIALCFSVALMVVAQQMQDAMDNQMAEMIGKAGAPVIRFGFPLRNAKGNDHIAKQHRPILRRAAAIRRFARE